MAWFTFPLAVFYILVFIEIIIVVFLFFLKLFKKDDKPVSENQPGKNSGVATRTASSSMATVNVGGKLKTPRRIDVMMSPVYGDQNQRLEPPLSGVVAASHGPVGSSATDIEITDIFE